MGNRIVDWIRIGEDAPGRMRPLGRRNIIRGFRPERSCDVIRGDEGPRFPRALLDESREIALQASLNKLFTRHHFYTLTSV